MKTFTVEVTQTVEVTLDETKFDEAFFQEFNRHFFNFGDDLNEHAKHIGQMFARGVEDDFSTFIEGYGLMKDLGISVRTTDCMEEVVNKRPEGKQP